MEYLLIGPQGVVDGRLSYEENEAKPEKPQDHSEGDDNRTPCVLSVPAQYLSAYLDDNSEKDKEQSRRQAAREKLT
jgi:hypothetical protein